MDSNQLALLWLSVGIFLIACEIFTGTFYLLLMGLSALVVAGISFLFQIQLWSIQVLMLGLLSTLSIFFIRGRLLTKLRRSDPISSSDESSLVTVLETIPAHTDGLVQYQGVPWTAHNQTEMPLTTQQVCVVVRTQGNKLIIKQK